MNNDIISEISEYLETRDTINMSKINKRIYKDRNEYCIYEVPDRKVEEIKYKIKGIRCGKIDEKIVEIMNNNAKITHLLCEEECDYDEFIRLKYVTNIRLKNGLCNIRACNNMYNIVLPKQIESFNIEYKYYDYSYTKAIYNIKEIIDMTNCNNLKHQEIYLNNTNILLPKSWENSNSKYINIIIDRAGEYDDLHTFINKDMVNKIKYKVKDYVSDNKFEKLELNLMDYSNVKILEIECIETSYNDNYRNCYTKMNVINELLIDIKHNESMEIINIKTWDKYFSYNHKTRELNEKIHIINDDQTNIEKIICFGRKIFHLHNIDYLYLDHT